MLFKRPDAVWLVDDMLFTGRGIRIPPRHQRVLTDLIRHIGEIRTDADLAAAAWPDHDGGIEWGDSELQHIVADLRRWLPKSVVDIESVMSPRRGRVNGRRLGWRLTGPIGFREAKDEPA